MYAGTVVPARVRAGLRRAEGLLRDARTDRGQSEAIGTILLVGIVVIVVATAGVLILGSIGGGGPPHVTVEAEMNETTVRLVHAGGESLAADALHVVLRNDTTRTEVAFAAGTLSGTADGQFDPGDVWLSDHGFPRCDRVDVYLVHAPSNSVVYEGTRVVGDCTA